MKTTAQFKRLISQLLLQLLLACFVFLPRAQAVSPAPDGGYAGNNTAEGTSALLSLTTGKNNTALGFETLKADKTGSFNTATGIRALLSNVSGLGNTADGAFALAFNTASYNTATGYQALYSDKGGDGNTAGGYQALYKNTASGNTANGYQALYNNTSGIANVATGYQALYTNTTANGNTADGAYALFFNTGADNTAVGDVALTGNTTGPSNTAVGVAALASNTTGGSNIALGYVAGSSLTTGSDNIDIGNTGMSDESGTIRIGVQGTQAFTYIAGIVDDVQGIGGIPVYVTDDGLLAVKTSSARFKDDIKPMDKASEAILALKPVTFRYKKKIDAKGIQQFGLVAEDVEKVNPDLVVRDKEGKPYSVCYEAVNAMLLNEFLKEHRAFVAEQRKVMEQQKEIDILKAELKEQRALIQKVSDKLEFRSTPGLVTNNRPGF